MLDDTDDYLGWAIGVPLGVLLFYALVYCFAKGCGGGNLKTLANTNGSSSGQTAIVGIPTTQSFPQGADEPRRTGTESATPRDSLSSPLRTAGTNQRSPSHHLTVPSLAMNPQREHTQLNDRVANSSAVASSSNGRERNSSFTDILSFKASVKDQGSACPVCLEELGKRSVSTGQCLHLVHTECLKRWLVTDKHCACPVCRLPHDRQEWTNIQG